ncbi:unnamed protein product, partial [Allacma fusca]
DHRHARLCSTPCAPIKKI